MSDILKIYGTAGFEYQSYCFEFLTDHDSLLQITDADTDSVPDDESVRFRLTVTDTTTEGLLVDLTTTSHRELLREASVWSEGGAGWSEDCVTEFLYHAVQDELRFNMQRQLAYDATGSMATEAEFVTAYAQADVDLARAGWKNPHTFIQ